MNISDGEALMSGFSAILLVVSTVGWLYVIGAAEESRREQDEGLPKDASWLGRVPMWQLMLTVGVVIILFTHVLGKTMEALLTR